MVKKRQSILLPKELATNLFAVTIRVNEEIETSEIHCDNEAMRELKIGEKELKKGSIQERKNPRRN